MNTLYQFFKRSNIFLLMLFICSFFVGCGNEEILFVNDIDINAITDEPLQEESEVRTIGVYVDATPSMEGYLGWHRFSLNKDYPIPSPQQEIDYNNIVQDTIYKRVLNKINNNITSDYNAEYTYYSMDTTLWSTALNTLTEAQNCGFYVDKYKSENKNEYKMVDEYKEYYSSSYAEPSISFAVKNASKEDLAIIITDLYENKKNSNYLINSLKESATEKGSNAGVALIGVMSQYAGRVYDIEGESEKNYGVVEEEAEVTEQSIKYRPFYIIVIGNFKKVEAFVETFKNEIDIENVQMKYTIQGDTEIYGLDYNDYEKYKFSNFQYISPSKKDVYHNEHLTEMKLLNIDKKRIESVEKLYLYYNITTTTLENYLELNVKSNQQTIEINEEEEEKGYPINNWYTKPMFLSSYGNEFFTEENTQGAMLINNVYWLKSKNQILLECNLNKDKLNSGIYKFAGTVYCEEHSSEDKWIMDWNSTSLKFEGEKTQNLNNFYKAVRNAFPIEDKKIVNFLFYFEI